MRIINSRDIMETIEMLTAENLDVRTVTMGINLFDCASSDFDTFAYKVRSKIFRYAEKLVETCDLVGDRYGIPVVNKRISVTPVSLICQGDPRPIAKALDRAAKNVGVNFIGGFSALVQKGMTDADRKLIAAIPEALANTDLVCSSVNVGSSKAGINMEDRKSVV